MTEGQRIRLERLARYRTAYEICAWHPDGRRFLIGYSPRLGKIGLIRAIQRVGERFVAAVGMTEDQQFTIDKGARSITIGDWKAGFTGRTQRESILSGNEAALLPDLVSA